MKRGTVQYHSAVCEIKGEVGRRGSFLIGRILFGRTQLRYHRYEQANNLVASGSGRDEDADGLLLPPPREWRSGYDSFLVAESVGAGILTLSLAVSKIGWGFGLLMYVFFSSGPWVGAASSP